VFSAESLQNTSAPFFLRGRTEIFRPPFSCLRFRPFLRNTVPFLECAFPCRFVMPARLHRLMFAFSLAPSSINIGFPPQKSVVLGFPPRQSGNPVRRPTRAATGPGTFPQPGPFASWFPWLGGVFRSPVGLPLEFFWLPYGRMGPKFRYLRPSSFFPLFSPLPVIRDLACFYRAKPMRLTTFPPPTLLLPSFELRWLFFSREGDEW